MSSTSANCTAFDCVNVIDNSVSGDNLVTSIFVNAILGLLCLLGFVIWRTQFGIYTTREHVPGVKKRPAKLPTNGFNRVWSWMALVRSVSDKEFLASAGFDALVSVRVISYGIALFLPLTIFGIGVLLPVNYTGGNLAQESADADSSNLTIAFLKMTISNIENGSPVLWVHCVFLFMFVFWACYLLLVFYEEHIAMQHTIAAARIGPQHEFSQTYDETLMPEDAENTVGVPQKPRQYAGTTAAAAMGKKAEVSDALAIEEVPTLSSDAVRVTSMSSLKRRGSSVQAWPEQLIPDPAAAVNNPKPRENQPESDYYELWPVRRGDPPHLAKSRPPYAGQYTVIVVDEPTRRFELKEKLKVMGVPVRLSRMGTLRETQRRTNIQQNWYWLGGSMNKRVSSRRDTLHTGADAEDTAPVGVGGVHNSFSQRGSRAVGMVDGDDITNGADIESHGIEDFVPSAELETATTKNYNDDDGATQTAQRTVTLSENAAGENQVLTIGGTASVLMPWESKIYKDDQALRHLSARMRVVAATFQRLFGDDFDSIIPVYPTERVDKALGKLYQCQAKIARLELQLEEAEKTAQKAGKLRKKVDALYAQELKLQTAASTLSTDVLNGPPCRTFIATFHTAKAAAMAVELNVNPVHWRGVNLKPGPDPDNINWTALQRSWWSRHIRSLIVLVAILFIMVFPFGLITGAFSQLESALCGGAEGTKGSLTGTWFCSDDFWSKFLRNIITGILPSILMSVYQSVILPVYIYSCAAAEARHVSLTELDRRCAELFFHWNWCNFFVQTLLGGALLNGLRQAIENPSSIFTLLGQAVPASANFFINYVLLRALTMTFFRLFWPHASVLVNILQWLYIFPKPKTPQDVAFATPLRNCRYSRDIGISTFAVYVSAIGYAVIAPFILPVALIYFVLMLFVWRYQQLYVFQAAYNSRGYIWSFSAHRVVACLAILVLFTSAMFFVKEAFVQGFLSLVVLESFIISFDKYLTSRYDAVFASTPIAILDAAPKVEMDPELYLPPPLRKGAEGWYLEWGKAWQGWGAPKYV